MARTRIIAEAANNHWGDLSLAKEMVWAAREAGADYVKFQSWQAKNLKPDEPDLERFKKVELSDEAHFLLMEEARKCGINFLTSCFDIARIDFLKTLGLPAIKVASPDAGSHRMIRLLRKYFPHIIISTGATYEEEIRKTAAILKGHSFTLLHCVTLYPTPPDKVNLSRMDWLRQFTPSVGFSDHTIGTQAARLAIARGADFVEKHFTVKRIEGQRFSMMAALPQEIKEIADYAREAEIMMGEGSVPPGEEEAKSRNLYIGRWGDNR